MSVLTERATTRRRRFPRVAALFLAPFFLLYGIFTVLPLLYSLGLSLFSERAAGGLGFGGTEPVFVGAANFARALGDAELWTGFVNVGLYCLVYIPVMISLALVLALLLDSAAARARSFFRLAFFVPHIVPALIASILWLYLSTPGLSPLVGALEATGGTWDLTSRLGALLALSNLSTWLHVGYKVILF